LLVAEALAVNSVAGDAFDAIDFLKRIIIRFATVMAEKVVAGR
jgi:hypothetical protein